MTMQRTHQAPRPATDTLGFDPAFKAIVDVEPLADDDATTRRSRHGSVLLVAAVALNIAILTIGMVAIAKGDGASTIPPTTPTATSATTIGGYETSNPLDPKTPEIFDTGSGLTIVPPPSQCHPVTNNQFAVTTVSSTTDGWTRGQSDAVTTSIEFYVVWSCDPAFADDAN